MLILGLNAYHGDSSACLIEDGVLIAAAEEERFTRIKHWAGFPANAVRWCLQERNIRLADLDVVAVNRDPRANLLKKMAYVVRQRPELRLILDRLKNVRHVRSITDDLNGAFPGETFRGEVAKVEHHLPPGFRVPGLAVRRGRLRVGGWVWRFRERIVGYRARIEDRRRRPGAVPALARHLLPGDDAIPWRSRTTATSTKSWGWRRTASRPVLHEMRRIVRAASRRTVRARSALFPAHQREDVVRVGRRLAQVENDLLNGARGAPRACPREGRATRASAQGPRAFCAGDVRGGVLPLARTPAGRASGGSHRARRGLRHELRGQRQGRPAHAVSRGIRAVGRGRRRRRDRCGDERRGRARQPAARSFVKCDTPIWGPQYSEEYDPILLDDRGRPAPCRRVHDRMDRGRRALCQRDARAVSDGLVVGWFQGRMEWGPRALGNRSIVCDPRRADMKDILNLQDQTPRVIPAVCAVGAPGDASPSGSRRTRTSRS